MAALKNLIQNDIIGSIEINLKLGNITEGDERRLRRLTHQLYQHIYAHYEEMEALNVITDESLMLDIDIIEKKHEEELNAKDKIIAKKDSEIVEKDNEIAEKDSALATKDSEIAMLKAQLAALQKS